jgi:hypothetical protein
MDVAKLDQYVTHVAKAIHICCKSLFKMFHLFLVYVTSVLSGYCKSRSGGCIYMHVASLCFKCFIRMLQVFHLGVAYICNWYTRVFKFFSSVFASVLAISDVCCKCFIWMFQKRSSVAHVTMGPACCIHLLQLLGCRRGSSCGRLRPTCASKRS